MFNIRIEVFPGSYDNSDAYENVINYIYKKGNIRGYGACGNTVTDYIDSFRSSEEVSTQNASRYIWHFIISFKGFHNEKEIINLAYQISRIFRNQYQIVFALDPKGTKLHVHFGVNAYSYIPDHPPLDESDTMLSYMHEIRRLIRNKYPNISVPIQFQNKWR